MPHATLRDGSLAHLESIYAVGRNYRAHARELGNEVPAEPFFFMKTTSSLWDGEQPVRLPFDRGPIHYEVEMVVLLSRGGEHLPADEARKSIGAVGVGLDLTLRELQTQLKQKGLPWALAKSFRNATILSPLAPVDSGVDLADLPLSLAVGGRVRQSDRTSSMIFDVGSLLAYLSARVPLLAGDLLFTGTPAGTAELARGDSLDLKLGDLAELRIKLA